MTWGEILEVVSYEELVLEGSLDWLDQVVFHIVNFDSFSKFGALLELLHDSISFLKIVAVVLVYFEIDGKRLDGWS